MGARVWLGISAACIGAVFAGVLLFLLFGRAWAAWGFFGAFAVLTVIGVAFGWYVDRRDAKRRGQLA
jgi:membrane protein implicated in regulation of membrane protease activity